MKKKPAKTKTALPAVYAQAYRSGVITISSAIDEDAIVIMQGSRRTVTNRVNARARHGYRRGVLLVPGVPEAENDDEALNALIAFERFLNNKSVKK